MAGSWCRPRLRRSRFCSPSSWGPPAGRPPEWWTPGAGYARGALGRSLPAFFAGEPHPVFGDIARALDGHVSQREAQLRPRDRRPFSVAYEICREPSTDLAIPRLRWTLEPIRTNNTSH